MTKKDFELFKKRVRYWRDILGARDWGLSVDMGELESDRAAQCAYENQNRYAMITIDKDTENTTRKNLDEAAKHEVLELVMADIREALCVFYNADFVDRQVHRVIRQMENALK